MSWGVEEVGGRGGEGAGEVARSAAEVEGWEDRGIPPAEDRGDDRHAVEMQALAEEHGGDFRRYLRSHGGFEETVADLIRYFRFLGDLVCITSSTW